MTKIRRIKKKEVKAAVALWAAWDQELDLAILSGVPRSEKQIAADRRSLAKILKKVAAAKDPFFLVALNDSQIVGIITAQLRSPGRLLPGLVCGEITQLYVTPEARGNNLGGELVRAAEAKLYKRGVQIGRASCRERV